MPPCAGMTRLTETLFANESKRFFFLKKKSKKTFAKSTALAQQPVAQGRKRFLVVFFKKEPLPS
jgi:hypothetical protein